MNTTLISPAEIRRIKEQALRKFVSQLTHRARDPATIGNRVLAVEHKLNAAQRQETLRHFQELRGISKPAASAAIIEAESTIMKSLAETPGG